MNRETLLATLKQSTTQLTTTLSRFTKENFNERPSDTEWSAAQIADHLARVYFSTIKAMSGDTIPTNRPPDQKIPLIKQTLEDDTARRVAPEQVRPSGDAGECAALILKLQHLEAKLERVIAESDITEACVSFRHPFLGTLTKMEWAALNNFHTLRHTRQLERLLQTISA